MFDFIKTAVEVIVDVLTGDGGSTEQPDTSDPCNATACVDAKERLTGEQKTYNTICLYFKMLRSVLDVAAAIIATPIWLIVVLIALAVLLPGPIAVLILALLAAYALSWYLVYALRPVVAKVGEALVIQQNTIMEAINVVIVNCPDHCRGDLSLPECE